MRTDGTCSAVRRQNAATNEKRRSGGGSLDRGSAPLIREASWCRSAWRVLRRPSVPAPTLLDTTRPTVEITARPAGLEPAEVILHPGHLLPIPAPADFLEIVHEPGPEHVGHDRRAERSRMSQKLQQFDPVFVAQ